MSTLEDHSLGFALESAWAVPKAPDHWAEWLESSGFDIDPNTAQGKGLQQGAAFPRAGRRVTMVQMASGKIEMEALSKGMGPLLQAWAGTSVSTSAGGGLFQQLHTFASTTPSLPTLAVQEGIVNADGALDAYSWRGCTVKSGELAVPTNGLATLKLDCDARAGHVTRTVADGATTNGSATLTSATGNFDFDDIGAAISGTGIPANTTILNINSNTSVTLSANATATGAAIAVTIGLAYAPPTYASGGSLFSSALPVTSAFVFGGSLTIPTTTALGTMTAQTTAVGLKAWSWNVNNGLDTGRDVIGGRNQAITGERVGTLKTTMEYDAATGRILQRYQTRQTQASILLTAQTAEVIGSGVATLQLAIPFAAIDSGAIPQPTDGKLVTTEIGWSGLKGSNAVAYLVYRTSDTTI